MQFRKMMVVAGLGMALLCAGATKAQEIVNTSFADGPNVTALPRPAVQANAAGGPATMAVTPQLPAAEPVSETGPTERMLWFGSFLVWLGAIGMYFSGPAVRFAREIRALRQSYKVSNEA